mmetsp:Transcript_16168/g.40904  ORF Transcript_16168/g.40904 Transcript_16168/m.40904 type:complete len:309 (+) Transcript_16168:687-1613(+)
MGVQIIRLLAPGEHNTSLSSLDGGRDGHDDAGGNPRHDRGRVRDVARLAQAEGNNSACGEGREAHSTIRTGSLSGECVGGSVACHRHAGYGVASHDGHNEDAEVDIGQDGVCLGHALGGNYRDALNDSVEATLRDAGRVGAGKGVALHDLAVRVSGEGVVRARQLSNELDGGARHGEEAIILNVDSDGTTAVPRGVDGEHTAVNGASLHVAEVHGGGYIHIHTAAGHLRGEAHLLQDRGGISRDIVVNGKIANTSHVNRGSPVLDSNAIDGVITAVRHSEAHVHHVHASGGHLHGEHLGGVLDTAGLA